MGVAIQASNLLFTFETNDGRVNASKDVNLENSKGVFHSFIGSSSSENVTFLRCATAQQPTGGDEPKRDQYDRAFRGN